MRRELDDEIEVRELSFNYFLNVFETFKIANIFQKKNIISRVNEIFMRNDEDISFVREIIFLFFIFF